MTGGKPYQSKLIPHENEIMAMRRKRPPVPYSMIATTLNEKYQLEISANGVFKFFKRLVTRKPRQYKYDAWDIELPEEPKQPEAASAQKATVSKFSVQEKPKQAEKDEIDIDEIMRELENHEIEYHDLASGYQPKFYPPEVAAKIRERIKRDHDQLKKEKEKKSPRRARTPRNLILLWILLGIP